MPWFHHPSFSSIRKRVLSQLASDRYTFRRLQPIVFLCGGANSDRRNYIDRYLKSNHPNLLIFYADDIWNALSSNEELNALAMEEMLADLSDIVIIVVESPGTFAEVGAFSLSESLRKKLLPILDLQFRSANSFLNTGPIRWIDAESQFRPSLWVPHTAILRAASDLSERISRITTRRTENIQDLASNRKYLLFLLRDLVAIFGPSSVEHIFAIANSLVAIPLGDIATLLTLAEAMNLIQSVDYAKKRYYLPRLENGDIRAHMRKKFLNIPALRAEVLSVLQTIPAGREILGEINQ